MAIDIYARILALRASSTAATSPFSASSAYNAGTIGQKLQQSVHVKDFGAAGNANYQQNGQWYQDSAYTVPATDDTPAFTAAMTYAQTNRIGRVMATGGTFLISSITIPAGICLEGGGAFRGSLGGMLVTAGAGTMVTLTGTSNYTNGGAAINGLGLIGYSYVSSTFSRGVYCNGGSGAVTNCSFWSFNNEGVRFGTSAVACMIEKCLFVNCVLNKAVTQPTGALTISGTDHYVSAVEAGCGQNVGWTISSSQLYVSGIALIGAGNSFLESCSGENADCGMFVDNNSYYCRFTNSRGDNNPGHGWLINGSAHSFVACLGNNNGQATNNVYDHFHITGTSMTFTGCFSYNDATHQTTQPAYAFNDTSSNALWSLRNAYVGCNPGGYATADYSVTAFLGSSPQQDARPVRDATATPNVTGSTFLIATGASVTITGLTGGFSGKTIRLLAAATGIILKSNSAIVTNTGADKTLTLNRVYRLTFYNGIWYEDI